MLESKHRIIRDVFERLKTSIPHDDRACISALNSRRALRISNDLYGNEVLSVYELEKGHPRSIEVEKSPELLTQDLFAANGTLLAKLKLTFMLRSKQPRNVQSKSEIWFRHFWLKKNLRGTSGRLTAIC